jgi:hypothetical protein
MKPEDKFKLINFFYRYYTKLIEDRLYFQTCHQIFLNSVRYQFSNNPQWLGMFNNLFDSAPEKAKLHSVVYFPTQFSEDDKAVEFFLKITDTLF